MSLSLSHPHTHTHSNGLGLGIHTFLLAFALTLTGLPLTLAASDASCLCSHTHTHTHTFIPCSPSLPLSISPSISSFSRRMLYMWLLYMGVFWREKSEKIFGCVFGYLVAMVMSVIGPCSDVMVTNLCLSDIPVADNLFKLGDGGFVSRPQECKCLLIRRRVCVCVHGAVFIKSLTI